MLCALMPNSSVGRTAGSRTGSPASDSGSSGSEADSLSLDATSSGRNDALALTVSESDVT